MSAQKISRFLLILLLSIFLLVGIALTLLFSSKTFQKWLAEEISIIASEQLNSKFSISNIQLDLGGEVQLESFLLLDQEGDTILYVKSLDIDLGLLALLKGSILIEELNANEIKSRILERSAGIFNFSFLIPESDTSKKEAFAWPIRIGNAHLSDLDFLYSAAASEIKVRNKSLKLAGEISLDQTKISLDKLELIEPNVAIINQEFAKDSTEAGTKSPSLIPDIGWAIVNKKLQISDAFFSMKQVGFTEKTKTFDWRNMQFEELQIDWENFWLEEKALVLDLNNLSFLEHSGLNLESLQSKIFLSDTLSLLENLQLKSNNSEAAFTAKASYLSPEDLFNLSATSQLDLALKPTYISGKDIAYFVPDSILFALPKYEMRGNLKGNLKEVFANNIRLQIGEKSFVKLDGKLQNLDKIESLKWENANLEIAAYEKDLSKVLKRFLPETKVFYYPSYSLKSLSSGSLISLELQNFILKAEQDLWLKLLGNYQHSSNAQTRHSSFSLDFRQLSANAFRPLIGENKWLENLEKIRIKTAGKLHGEALNSEWDIQTSAGLLKLNLDALLANDFLPKHYELALESSNFNLQKLEIDSNLKSISFNAKVEGEGLDLEALSAFGKLDISALYYAQHQWQGINLEADFAQEKLETKLSISDSFAHINLAAFWQMAEQDSIAFSWNIDSLLGKAIGLNYAQYSASSMGDLQYIGDFQNLHSLRVQMDSLRLKNDSSELVQNNFHLQFEQVDSTHSEASVKSDILNINWHGPTSKNWANIPPALLQMSNNYFPVREALGLERADSLKAFINQKMNLDIELSKPSKWLSYFLPDLQKLDTLGLSLSWSPEDTLLDLEVFSPSFNYAGMGWEKMWISSNGKESALDFKLHFDSLFVKNQVNIEEMEWRVNVLNDSLFSAYYIWSDSNKIALNIQNLLLKEEDNYKLYFNNPFILNEEIWTIDKGNYITIGADNIDLKTLSIHREKQEFSIGKMENSKGLNIALKEFDITEFSKILSLTQPDLRGILNASIAIKIFPEFELDSDFQIKNFHIENEDAGTFELTAKYKDDIAICEAELRGKNGELDLFAEYSIPDKNIDARLDIPKIPVGFIATFLPEYADSSSGFLSGNAQIHGAINKPIYSGKLALENVRAWIKPLQTYYSLDGDQIEMDNKHFQIRNLKLKDRYGASAQLKGSVLHNNFDEIKLFLQMEAQDFTLFEIPKNDKEALSGTLRLSFDAKVRGNIENPVINLNANTKEKTDLLLSLVDEERAISQEDYLFFTDPELADTTNGKGSRERMLLSESGISLFMNLQVSDAARLRIVVDPVSGDYLELNGNSNLSVAIEPNKTALITGNYTVKSGLYRFSYEQVLKKQFSIVEGSNIIFTGDPMEAQLAINANYSTETTTFELIENQSSVLSNSELDASRKKTTVNVLLRIGGVLSKPELSFDIQIPSGGSNLVSSSVARRLSQLRMDEASLNQQVFALLLFNSFMSSGGSGGNIGNSGEAAAISSISKLINNQLNKLAKNHVKAIDISFAFDAYKDKFSETDKTLAEVGLDLSKSFLNDRLSLKVGGNLNLENNSVSSEDAQAMKQLNNDFVIEYKLSKNGRYSVKVFQESNYDLVDNNNIFKTGVGLSFSESFGKALKKKETQNEKEEEVEDAQD